MLRLARARLLATVFASMVLQGLSASHADTVRFELSYVDLHYGGNGKPGWARAGDMDGDGDVDIVAGGGRALFVYENDGRAGGWQRHGNLDGSGNIGANGAVLDDVDGDGDLDVVSARYFADLGWWENPGGRLETRPWAFHAISDSHGLIGKIGNVVRGRWPSWFLHDIIRADLDGDGVAAELIANFDSGGFDSDVRILWLRRPRPATWEVHVVEAGRNGAGNNHAGLDVGDVDGDGKRDISYSNGWYRAGDSPEEPWTWYELTETYGVSNSLLRDVDADGDLDVVISAGHHGSGVFWLENRGDPTSGPWSVQEIDASVQHPECLAVFDLDTDGDLDVITCDLDFSRWSEQVHNVYWIEHDPGAEDSWARKTIAANVFPSHLLQTADVDGDGRTDLLSEAAGHSVVSYYRNVSR